MKRPALVTVISIVTFIGGLFGLLFGAVMLANRKDIFFLAEADATTNQVTSIGIYLVIVGALGVIAAVGLWRGSRLWRGVVGVIELAQIAGAIYTLVALGSDQQSGAIGQIAGAVVVLYFLFGTEKSKQFFAH